MEYIVITQEGDFLDLARLFVLFFKELPEHDHMGLLAATDITTRRLNLLIGRIFARTAQEHLVQQGIGLASRI